MQVDDDKKASSIQFVSLVVFLLCFFLYGSVLCGSVLTSQQTSHSVSSGNPSQNASSRQLNNNYKNHTIARRRFSFIEAAESFKQLPQSSNCCFALRFAKCEVFLGFAKQKYFLTKNAKQVKRKRK